MTKSLFSSLSKRSAGIRPSPTFEVARLIREIENTGKKVINFGIGNPPQILDLMSQSMRKEVEKAWNEARHKMAEYYPSFGLNSLREFISQRFGDFSKEEILITGGGGKGGLHLALYVCTDPGDKVIVPVPCWPTYFDMVRNLGGEVIPLSTYDSGFYLDPQKVVEIFKKNKPKPKAILYNSPNNPTGKIIDSKDMEKIDKIAVENNAVVISDEAYRGQELTSTSNFTRCSVNKNNGVKIRVVSFSKLISVAGERLGFVEAPVHLISKMAEYQSNHSGNPPVAAMIYAQAILSHPDWNEFRSRAMEALRRKQEAAWKILERYAINFVKPEGAFYIYLHIPGIADSDAFSKKLLIEEQVGLIPGVVFDPLEGGIDNPQKHHYFRMAIGVASIEEIEEGIKRIKKQIEKKQ